MKIKSYYIHILTFITPLIIISIVFSLKGIIPFGNNTIFDSDSLSQYAMFHSELADKLQSGDSLLYSFRNGMGTDFLVQSSYYLTSPSNILLIFVPSEYIALYFTLTVIIKLGLAGLFMGIYIKKHFGNISPILTLTFACCYSLCSYSVHYYSNLMWLDGFMLFPLVILCLEKLYNNKKPYMYSIILGITIISNFYIGFMVCLFCVLYYMYLLFTDRNISFKNAIRHISRFISYSLIAGGISSFVIIPAFLGLISSISGNTSATNLFSEYYPFYVNLFRLMFNASPTFMHSPYLHTSVVAFLILPLFFANRNIDKRIRLGRTILLLIMLLSFQFKILDYIWNGLHITKGFAGRQSFIFIFLIIIISIDELLHYTKKDLLLTVSFGVSAIIIAFSYIYYDLTSILYLTIFNIILLVIYYFVFKSLKSTLDNTHHTVHNKTTLICCSLIVLELILSTYYAIKPGLDYDYYKNTYLHSEDTISLIDDDSLFRIKNDCKTLQNEGCILSYNSIPIYSSFTSNNIADTLLSFGYYIGDNAYDDIANEPITMSLLGIKYVISANPNLESDYLELIGECDEEYIYMNRHYLPIGFATSNILPTDDSFNTENPFDTINSIVYSLSGIEDIYTPITLDNELDNGKDIYVYSMDKLSNVIFKSHTGTEEILYPNDKIMVFAKRHNYICHITDSKYGGSLLTDSDLSDVMAYSLDYDKYLKFTKILSASSLDIVNYNSGYIEGLISITNDGHIFTSIPYSDGWTVKVDGKKVESYGVHDSLLAFDIEAGEHFITFEYTTKGLLIGSLLSVISIIILICVTIISHIRISHKRL